MVDKMRSTKVSAFREAIQVLSSWVELDEEPEDLLHFEWGDEDGDSSCCERHEDSNGSHARVLMKEELQYVPSGIPLWWELRSDGDAPFTEDDDIFLLDPVVFDRLQGNRVFYGEGDWDEFDKYSRQYRLWTERPTIEQRVSAKWDA